MPLLVVAVVVVTVGLVVSAQAKNYYLFAPGTAPRLTASATCSGPSELKLPGGAPCARIDVPPSLTHPVSGRLLMVDINVGPATGVEYLLDKVGLLSRLDRGYQLVPAQAYTGGQTPRQVQCADTAQMTGAQQDAPVAALRRLGYRVSEVDRGAAVAQVSPGTPAAGAGLECNDVITGIDGHIVRTAQDLIDALHGLPAGQKVSVTAMAPGTDGKVVTRTVDATLTTTPPDVAKATGRPASTGFLGVGTTTDVSYRMPFAVSIDAGNIGGPSAGLAFALGVIDLVSGGHLTGDHTVAATGQIDPNGNVLDVGGVAQKAIAVERAGATAFIVPSAEVGAAQSSVGNKVKVYGVTTLDQALADLSAMGGTVPAANFAASHPAPPA
ncbi:MAG: PDZ domain-containing protein [Acidimicrobiales bacterium]